MERIETESRMPAELPSFKQPLHVGRPNIGDRDGLIERINAMLDRRWLSNNGPFVQQFELRVAELIGVSHCIACCNATVALELAIRAAGLKGEVIVPAFTFIATAHSLQWQEITPVFCDIDPETHCLDPWKVESLITPRTTGIIGVHVWGRPCAVDALQEIATRRSLTLLFDAAHAFGCSLNGRMIGGFGKAEVFSFHATKFLNTFEGGAIVTNDDELAAKIRLMKNFGFAGMDNVIYIGTNGKMTEVSAAMGLTNLESMDAFIAVNRHNYLEYQRGLADVPGISLIRYEDTNDSNFQYIVLEVDREVTGISRDRLVQILHGQNVLARRYFYPGVHRMEPYRSYFPQAGLSLPETDALCRRVLLLPTGTAVNEQAIADICKIIKISVEDARSIKCMSTLGKALSPDGPKAVDPLRPLVTVATTCYNHERFLGEYFEGLLAQTYDNVELIIFDDESTDRSWQIIKQYEPQLREKFPRVICERHKNMYVFKELAEALRRATGEFFCVLESDDYYLSTKIEDNVRYLVNHPDVGLVYSAYDTIEYGQVVPADLQKFNQKAREGWVFEDLCNWNFIMTLTACFRTELARQYVDLEDYERQGFKMGDLPMWLDLAAHTQFGYISKPLARYRIHMGSASRPTDPVKNYEFWKSVREVFYIYSQKYSQSEENKRRVEKNYYEYIYMRAYELYLPEEFQRAEEYLCREYPQEFETLRERILAKSMRNKTLWKFLRDVRNSQVIHRAGISRYIPNWSTKKSHS